MGRIFAWQFALVWVVAAASGPAIANKPVACETFPLGKHTGHSENHHSYSGLEFSADGSSILMPSMNGRQTAVFHLANGESVMQDNARAGENGLPLASPDGTRRLVASTSAENEVRLEDAEGQYLATMKSNRADDQVVSVEFSPSGTHALVIFSYGLTKVLRLSPLKEFAIKNYGVREAKFSPKGNEVAVVSIHGGAKVVNVHTGKETPLPKGKSGYGSVRFSPDASHLLSTFDDGTVSVLNRVTNKRQTLKHEGVVTKTSFSRDGGSVLTVGEDGRAKILHLRTGARTELPLEGVVSAAIAPGGLKVAALTNRGAMKVMELNNVCVPLGVVKFVSNAPFVPDCMPGKHKAALPEIRDFTRSLREMLCQEAFDEKSWNAATGPLGAKLAPEAAELLLLRFQKPGGFRPEEHLASLHAILNSPFAEQQPALVAGALQGVLHRSNALYEHLITRYPKAFRPFEGSPPVCRTPKEEEEMRATVKEFAEYRIQSGGRRSVLRDWDIFHPLRPVLASLPAETKEELHDEVARLLADHAVESDFSQYFHSKIYKFVANAVKPLFGETPLNLTDITVLRSTEENRVALLGSHPMKLADGKATEQNNFGFHGTILGTVNLPKAPSAGQVLMNREFHWDQGGESFHAAVKVDVGEKREIVSSAEAPEYDRIWADKRREGVIIAGSNLGLETAKDVTASYRQFYESRGFQFPQPEKSVAVGDWLEKGVASGQLDYLLKEAHSDGDEKNVFRHDKEALILKGRRNVDGRGEDIVHLIFPKGEKSPNELLPNQKFGKWLRARDDAKGGPFMFFNTSCWSHTKAVHEIEAAGTKTLVDIPTLTTADTFTNEEETSIYQMLEGFLQERTYEEMRAAMEKDLEYKERRANVYLFPDERDYKANILRVVATPLQTQVSIRDAKGRKYSLEQDGH